MATSFVEDGTLSEAAFLERGVFARDVHRASRRFSLFLKQLRERTGNPDFMANVEEVYSWI